MVKAKIIFAWYDLWVGAFWDQKKRWLYIFPIPMLGLVLKFRKRKGADKEIEMWQSQYY